MSERLRVGIVGAVSAYSLYFAEALHQMEDADLVGVAHLGRSPRYIRHSLNLPWLAKYTKSIESSIKEMGAGFFEQPDEMLEAGGLDAVCITTEDYLRRHYALWAVDRGLHLILPKPFAQSRQEAETVFAAAAEKGVVAWVSLPYRHTPGPVKARELIDSGAIGRPISGHFVSQHHITLGGWKSDPHMAAGPEFEVGFYTFDLVRMLMKSEPRRVRGWGANLDHQGIPYIDNGKCVIECQNGALASVDLVLSMHQPVPEMPLAYVVGNEGALVLSGNRIVVRTPDGEETLEAGSWNPNAHQLAAWLEACRGRGDAAQRQREGLLTLDLIAAYKASYLSGEPVEWEG